MAYIWCEFYIIEDLRVYILININIIVTEYIYLNFNRFIIMVVVCKNTKFNILIIILDPIMKIIFLKAKIRILIKLNKLILIIGLKYKLLNLLYNKDFIF